MLKILDIGQLRELDAYTIRHEPIKSIDLMERACEAFVKWFTPRFDITKSIAIVCGTGNNGGDGLGIARLLTDREYIVCVYIVRGGKESEDFATNLERLQGSVDVNEFGTDTSVIADCDVLIDALFGSGLTRLVAGMQAVAIKAINDTEAVRIAVDIPSGLFADQHSSGPVVMAHYTVTFQLPKLAFLLPENGAFVGNWFKADIGLSKRFIKECKTSRYYMTRWSARKMVKPRDKFSHKGKYGHALLVAGSVGKFGAALLATRGALRAGVGLITVHIPRNGNDIIQTAAPEAMVSLDLGEDFFTEAPALDAYDVIGIGPGIGQTEKTILAFRKVLEHAKHLVIDADAINILALKGELLHLVPPGSILTPHPKEFERLVGPWKDDFERMEKQAALAKKIKSVVLVKGAHTTIATPQGIVYFNSTGNPGMATGGSGDVLTGILTGLLAQGYEPADAALLGAFLHGFAGDLASLQKGVHSLIATDLVDYLPLAFKMTVSKKG